MRESVIYLVLVLICSLSHGQVQQQSQGWPADKFTNVERHLDNIQMYVKSLQDIIYQERMKHQPFLPNSTAGGATNMAYTSFINDVESRLAKMEFATSELVKKMTTCPGDPQPPPPPQNVMVDSVTVGNSSSIVVSWDRPSTPGGQPIPDENLQYKVYFVPIDEYGQQSAGEVVFSICDASQTSASITDLYPRSFYKIWVGAVQCLAAESSSNPRSMKTPDIIPSEPRNLRVEGTKANAIRLRWDPPIARGLLKNYTIYYTDETGMPKVVVVDPPVEYFLITDLIEGTLYTFQVSAFSDNGESPKSLPKEVRTDVYIPSAPRNLRFVDKNMTSIRLAWDPPRPGAGIIRGYQVNYTMDFDKFESLTTPDATFTEAVIAGLRPATLYYFIVSARTGRSVGNSSAVLTEQTNADVPSPPMHLHHVMVNNAPPMIRLLWHPPENPYGAIKDYTIHWGVRGGAVREEIIKSNLLSWESDYLDYDTTHEIALHANNAVGKGRPARFIFTTPKLRTIVPPNVSVSRDKQNSSKLLVTWGTPREPVDGFRILYRKFEVVYTGRWKLKEINNPFARSAEIVLDKPGPSFVVVVRGYKNDPYQIDPPMGGGGGFGGFNPGMQTSGNLGPGGGPNNNPFGSGPNPAQPGPPPNQGGQMQGSPPGGQQGFAQPPSSPGGFPPNFMNP